MQKSSTIPEEKSPEMGVPLRFSDPETLEERKRLEAEALYKVYLIGFEASQQCVRVAPVLEKQRY